MDRLSMASALVARARAHKAWIGDDHGDRYEDAMMSRAVAIRALRTSRSLRLIALSALGLIVLAARPCNAVPMVVGASALSIGHGGVCDGWRRQERRGSPA